MSRSAGARLRALLLVVVMAVPLVGCDFFDNLANTRIQHRVIHAGLGVHSRVFGGSSGPCIGLPFGGLPNPELETWRAAGGFSNGALVSFRSSVTPGPQPFPCDRWTFSANQAKLTFVIPDLPPGTLVTDATVTITFGPVVTVSPTTRLLACGGVRGMVFARMGVPAGFVPGGALSTGTPEIEIRNPVRGTRLNVLGSVRAIAGHGSQPFTVVVTPRDGLIGRMFAPSNQSDLSRSCATTVTDAVLDITARVPRP